MKLLIPQNIKSQFVDALRKSDRREIGGILMGEHIEYDTFRVREITIQRKGGSFAAFVRAVTDIIAPLHMFFEATKHNYKRFNYIGEWHSHHSFELIPSRPDHAAMYELISDSQVGANFVILLLVKLNNCGDLECGVTIYKKNTRPFCGITQQE